MPVDSPEDDTADRPYDEHAFRMNQEASAEYQRWYQSLSPAQRAKVDATGLTSPVDSHEVPGHAPSQMTDAAEHPAAKMEIDFAQVVDSPVEMIAERFKVSMTVANKINTWHNEEMKEQEDRQQAFLLQRIIGGLLSSSNVKVSAAGLAFAAGLNAVAGFGSENNYAKKIGVSRQTICRASRHWKDLLNLPTSRHHKSEKAIASYSKVGKERHWRKSKATASQLLSKMKYLRK